MLVRFGTLSVGIPRSIHGRSPSQLTAKFSGQSTGTLLWPPAPAFSGARMSKTIVVGNYVVTSVLGSGSFATVSALQNSSALPLQLPLPQVYKANNRATGEDVAIKAVSTRRLDKKAQANLDGEVSILQRIDHVNVVRLLDVQKSEKFIYLVFEFCAGGDLSRLIQSQGPFSEAQCRAMLRQLAKGIEFMWSHNLIHRDLKPQNILLSAESPDAIIKIADFGFARHLETSSLADTLCGSPLYMAPEILRYQRYDAKADLWSVGTILFEMLAKRPPFSGSNHLELLANIERSEAQLPPEVTVTKECTAFLQGLLRRNPHMRMSFQEFFASPFLQGSSFASPSSSADSSSHTQSSAGAAAGAGGGDASSSMGSLIDMGTAFAAVGAHLASSSSRVSTGTAGASASDRPKMDIDGGVYPQTFTQGFPALPPTPSVDGSSAGSGWTDPPRLVKPPPLLRSVHVAPPSDLAVFGLSDSPARVDSAAPTPFLSHSTRVGSEPSPVPTHSQTDSDAARVFPPPPGSPGYVLVPRPQKSPEPPGIAPPPRLARVSAPIIFEGATLRPEPVPLPAAPLTAADLIAKAQSVVRECKVMGGHASTLVALASCFVSCGGVDGGCWVLGSREGEDAPFSPHTHEARTMVRSVIDSVLAQENTGEDSPELGELRALERTPVALDNPIVGSQLAPPVVAIEAYSPSIPRVQRAVDGGLPVVSVPLLPADLCAQRRRDAANMCALALYVRACGMLEAAFHAADALLGSREERKEGEGNGWDAEPLSLCGKSLKDVKAWLHLCLSRCLHQCDVCLRSLPSASDAPSVCADEILYRCAVVLTHTAMGKEGLGAQHAAESKSVYSQASLLLSVLVRSGTGFDDDTSAALKAANALVDRRLQEWDSDTPHSSPFVVV